MEIVITGFLIITFFALRPFVYKPASLTLSSATSSYFTAFYCMLFLIPSVPFCWHYFFMKNQIVLFNPWIIVPILKGVLLFFTIKYSQELNKENTSASVFWGIISLSIATILAYLFFSTELSMPQTISLIAIGFLGLLFFTKGEGKRLSKQGRKAFVGICMFSSCCTICDILTITYLNWYLLLFFSYIAMLAVSLFANKEELKLKQLLQTRHIVMAGVIFSIGEILLIFSMNSFFPVLAATFLLRIAQSIDMVLIYHIYKEGTSKVQYFFALGIITVSYFFYFG